MFGIGSSWLGPVIKGRGLYLQAKIYDRKTSKREKELKVLEPGMNRPGSLNRILGVAEITQYRVIL